MKWFLFSLQGLLTVVHGEGHEWNSGQSGTETSSDWVIRYIFAFPQATDPGPEMLWVFQA